MTFCLRAGHGKAATMKVGERYPIVSSQFSATSATSSILSALGMSTSAGAGTSIPSPQFCYEDLGLVLKATPQVHGKLVSLDYELTLRALGATQSNGLPLLTNREMKGTISTEDGEGVVIAGLLEKDEMNAINGIPVAVSGARAGQGVLRGYQGTHHRRIAGDGNPAYHFRKKIQGLLHPRPDERSEVKPREQPQEQDQPPHLKPMQRTYV